MEVIRHQAQAVDLDLRAAPSRVATAREMPRSQHLRRRAVGDHYRDSSHGTMFPVGREALSPRRKCALLDPNDRGKTNAGTSSRGTVPVIRGLSPVGIRKDSAIPSSPKPASRRTCSVCSPRRGARRRRFSGVADILIGVPSAAACRARGVRRSRPSRGQRPADRRRPPRSH